MNIYRLSLTLFCCALISVASAQEYKNELGFRSDNDSYLGQGQDRYYTNGLFITFRHATANNPLNSTRLNKKIWEAEIGQRMYNAHSGYVPDITYVDRPFTAYLYAGGSMEWFYNSEDVFKINVQAGTIGPAALGEEAQEFLHSIIGFYKPNGWQYQLKNEFGINTSLDYSHFFFRNEQNSFDLSAGGNLNIGNTYSGAGINVLLRAGKVDNFFHSAINNSRISNGSNNLPLTKRELFFYARPMLNFVAYDATIQGGAFINDKGPVTYDKKPLVLAQELGAMFSGGRWTADFSVIFKTKEVKSTASPHQYGSISLYYRFN